VIVLGSRERHVWPERETAAGVVSLRMPGLLALLSAACLAAGRGQRDEGLRTRALSVMFDGLRGSSP
jgi:hypothetical protein